jgi:CDP-glucose 4,6-dehydratase
MEKSDFTQLKSLTGPILITGHTGFKGTWLTLLLEELGIQAVGISLPPEDDSLYTRAQRFGKIPEQFLDILDSEDLLDAVRKFNPSAIFHLAAQPLVIKSYDTPRETFLTNVIGTLNILESALKAEKVKSVGVITTDKVYRNNGVGETFDETFPLEGKDPYSASKVGAEAVVTAWRQLSRMCNGPQIISLRAGNVIGGGDWAENRLLPDIIKAKQGDSTLLVRNSESTRPWQHVLDPIYGYLLAVEKSLTGDASNAYNFGPTEKSMKVGDVVNISNVNWKIETAPIENNNTEKKEASELNLNVDLALKELNWKPRFSQEQAIQATINWWDLVSSRKLTPTQACLADIRTYLERALN